MMLTSESLSELDLEYRRKSIDLTQKYEIGKIDAFDLATGMKNLAYQHGVNFSRISRGWIK